MITIHEFQEKKYKNYYGASKKVFQKSHMEKVLEMKLSFNTLLAKATLCKIVPYNEEFLVKKAIPMYNNTLERLQQRYPNIQEFHDYRKIRLDFRP